MMNLSLTDTTITSKTDIAGISGFVGSDGANYSTIYLSGEIYIDSYVLINANISPFVLNGNLTENSLIYVGFLNGTGSYPAISMESYITIATPSSSYRTSLSVDENKVNIGLTNADAFKILANNYYVISDSYYVIIDSETLTYPVVKLQSYESAMTVIYWDPVSGNINGTGASEGTAVKTFEKVLSLSNATNISSSAISTVYMLSTYTLTQDTTFSTDKIIISRYFAGERAFTGVLFIVPSGLTLTLENITIDGGETANINTISSLIIVQAGGKLIINDGAVLRNHMAKIDLDTPIYGGVINNSGTLIINGGQFYSNGVDSYGYGGVVATSGEMTVNGGIFYDNSSITGGSVFCISGGTVNINGGVFYRNSNLTIRTGSIPYGGTFLVLSGASLNIFDGMFFDNVAKRGAVICSYGTVNVIGGVFYSNEAEETLSSNVYSGTQGGVMAVVGGTTTIYGGTFTKNEGSYGAVIFLENATVNMQGGVYTENRAMQIYSTYPSGGETRLVSCDGMGGVAYISTNGVLNLYDGELINNETSSKGGAIYNAGTLKMTGGILSGNIVSGLKDKNGALVSASGFGGAIYSISTGTVTGGVLYNKTSGVVNHITNSKFTISGGLIEYNIANYAGGGIAVVGTLATLVLSNININNNHTLASSSVGGAIYVASKALIEICAGTEIANNYAVYGGAISLFEGNLLMTDGIIFNNGIFNEQVKAVTGSAIYSNGIAEPDTIILLGGEITENYTSIASTGAIHVSTKSLYVGKDVFVCDNFAGTDSEKNERNIYLSYITDYVQIIENFNLGAYLGIYSTLIFSGNVHMIAMPQVNLNYALTNKVLNYIVSDSLETYLYLDNYTPESQPDKNIECLYMGPKETTVEASYT
ncbi:MAG: hypothetical protein EOM05_10325, partial [Clostridia bacterium]|nr:hypothetical protein [Clostridia bacterium]